MIDEVKVGHVRYEVRYEPGLSAITETTGVCGQDVQTILIDDGIGIDQERETVLHEILHGVVHATGFKDWLDEIGKEAGVKELEEKIISLLSGKLLQLIQDNPEFIQYLVGPDDIEREVDDADWGAPPPEIPVGEEDGV